MFRACSSSLRLGDNFAVPMSGAPESLELSLDILCTCDGEKLLLFVNILWRSGFHDHNCCSAFQMLDMFAFPLFSATISALFGHCAFAFVVVVTFLVFPAWPSSGLVVVFVNGVYLSLVAGLHRPNLLFCGLTAAADVDGFR